jgi:hypothetical protein
MKSVPMDNLKILDGFLVPKTATAQSSKMGVAGGRGGK